jgi:hypothetical protein
LKVLQGFRHLREGVMGNHDAVTAAFDILGDADDTAPAVLDKVKEEGFVFDVKPLALDDVRGGAVGWLAVVFLTVFLIYHVMFFC